MGNNYRLRYLPLFEQDLLEIVDYISNVLKNPSAAERLINDLEAAILNRLNFPRPRAVFPVTFFPLFLHL